METADCSGPAAVSDRAAGSARPASEGEAGFVREALEGRQRRIEQRAGAERIARPYEQGRLGAAVRTEHADQASLVAQLVEQGLRPHLDAALDENRVEGAVLDRRGQAALDDRGVAAQALAGGTDEIRGGFEGDDLGAEAAQDGRAVTVAGADIEGAVAGADRSKYP